MKRQKPISRHAVTLIEMVVTMAMATIVLLGIGVVLVDTHKGYNNMYERVFGEVITDSYVTTATFESVVRKSTIQNCTIDASDPAQFVYVYYYSDPNSEEPDSYATFYKSGTNLMVAYGSLQAGTYTTQAATSTTTLARNVESVEFSVPAGSPCIQIVLTLTKGNQTLTITTSPARHNP